MKLSDAIRQEIADSPGIEEYYQLSPKLKERLKKEAPTLLPLEGKMVLSILSYLKSVNL